VDSWGVRWGDHTALGLRGSEPVRRAAYPAWSTRHVNETAAAWPRRGPRSLPWSERFFRRRAASRWQRC